MSSNHFITYNKKHKCTEITEKMNGSAKYVICAICGCPMFPKKIIFRTLRNNDSLIFNFIGKNGHGCFIQKKGIIFCKQCCDLNECHINDEDYLIYDKQSMLTDEKNKDIDMII